MKAFETSIENILYRFGLMMAIVIVTISAGVPFLSLLAVPVFLSGMLGIKFISKEKATKAAAVKKIVRQQDAA